MEADASTLRRRTGKRVDNTQGSSLADRHFGREIVCLCCKTVEKFSVMPGTLNVVVYNRIGVCPELK